jgi:hypothetical protein
MRSDSETGLSEVVLKPRQFSHHDADAISRWAFGSEAPHTVVVDLSHVTDATTAAFATLVVLRRQLLRDGRDLRLSGCGSGHTSSTPFPGSRTCSLRNSKTP